METTARPTRHDQIPPSRIHCFADFLRIANSMNFFSMLNSFMRRTSTAGLMEVRPSASDEAGAKIRRRKADGLSKFCVEPGKGKFLG